MIGTANDNPGWGLLLEVALETKVSVARHQHLVVDRSVWVVTSGASFAHRLVFEHKRTTLRGVATAAGVVLGQQRGSSASYGGALMWVMTTAAAHFAIQHWMAVGQLELTFLVEMTLKADFGRSFGIQDGVICAPTLIVNAARPVTGFAANLLAFTPSAFRRAWVAVLKSRTISA